MLQRLYQLHYGHGDIYLHILIAINIKIIPIKIYQTLEIHNNMLTISNKNSIQQKRKFTHDMFSLFKLEIQ